VLRITLPVRSNNSRWVLLDGVFVYRHCQLVDCGMSPSARREVQPELRNPHPGDIVIAEIIIRFVLRWRRGTALSHRAMLGDLRHRWVFSGPLFEKPREAT
jgi:hypothetical protein